VQGIGQGNSFIDHLCAACWLEIRSMRSSRPGLASFLAEAANILARMLNSADRIKLIPNLISRAYHQRSRFTFWLGEIVALADLLRLDVNFWIPLRSF
jgi:hypothetical protein